MLKKVRSRFSVETDLSQSTEIFLREKNFEADSANKDRQISFICFRNFLVPKSLWTRAGTRITAFRRKRFVSLHRKLSYKNPSVFRNFSAYEKFYVYEENVTTFYGEFVI